MWEKKSSDPKNNSQCQSLHHQLNDDDHFEIHEIEPKRPKWWPSMKPSMMMMEREDYLWVSSSSCERNIIIIIYKSCLLLLFLRKKTWVLQQKMLHQEIEYLFLSCFLSLEKKTARKCLKNKTAKEWEKSTVSCTRRREIKDLQMPVVLPLHVKDSFSCLLFAPFLMLWSKGCEAISFSSWVHHSHQGSRCVE